jgi:hypothetical protein
MDNCEAKIRDTRSYLHGWAKNLSGVYKTEKVCLQNIIGLLDTRAKTCPLKNDERSC